MMVSLCQPMSVNLVCPRLTHQTMRKSQPVSSGVLLTVWYLSGHSGQVAVTLVVLVSHKIQKEKSHWNYSYILRHFYVHKMLCDFTPGFETSIIRKVCYRFLRKPLNRKEILCFKKLVSKNWQKCPFHCTMFDFTRLKHLLVGYQSRVRSVVVHPDNRGRLCPKPTYQERPCSYTECFRWELGDWNPCRIDVCYDIYI